QQWALHVEGSLHWAFKTPLVAFQARVETDRADQAELLVGRRQERLPASEAEAHGHEARLAHAPADLVHRGHRVRLDLRRARLWDVLHVLEVLAAWTQTRGPPEEVDHDRM